MAVGYGGLQRLVFTLIYTQYHPCPQPVFTDIDLFYIGSVLQDSLGQKAAQHQLSQILGNTDQLHGQSIVEIDVQNMLCENRFGFGMTVAVPVDIGIGFRGKKRKLVV